MEFSRADFSRLLAEPGVSTILRLINQGGYEARIVGGAVRNVLMGLPSKDIDIATTATPQQVMALAARMQIRALPVGLAHGTVTLVVGGQNFEITTLRQDVVTDGRHAKVKFSQDFAVDAARRDFTVNALSLSLDGTLHDYVGGLADIKARHIRFIGNPAQRIAEDRLRVLRFFRFYAVYGQGAIDAAGLKAAIAARQQLSQLSPERLQAEMGRLLDAADPVPTLQIMADTDILPCIIGGMAYPNRVRNLLRAVPTADRTQRLAALAVTVAEDADRLRDRLRLSNAVYKRLHAAAGILSGWHGRALPPSQHELMAAMLVHSRPATLDGLALVLAQAPREAAQAFGDTIRLLRDAKPPKLPLSGMDVLKSQPMAGARVGQILKALQARWIRAGFPNGPAALSALLEEAIASVEKDAGQ
ncbi:MAG: CCA tRNA nucleotidyltransferase [Hyphomicrobiales bacterium]|nr:CCA tRNA nucleotidyltransferase [Hyphomicrobiales bacterium]MDE2114959.1 CCA tRNA nucleotidyltransferase [Hyphomicrobiales bacterium]